MLSWQEECKKMPAGYVNLEFSNLKSFQEDLTSLRKIAQFVPVRIIFLKKYSIYLKCIFIFNDTLLFILFLIHLKLWYFYKYFEINN